MQAAASPAMRMTSLSSPFQVLTAFEFLKIEQRPESANDQRADRRLNRSGPVGHRPRSRHRRADFDSRRAATAHLRTGSFDNSPHRVGSMNHRFSIAILVLGVGLAACSTDEAAGTVADFGDIVVTDPVLEFDPSGTTATLIVSTTLNAVCAVTYGIDGPFGFIATDSDMGAGSGHRDHRPMMTGLQPGTEYQYRLQGVAEDGLIYQSAVFTFTTPSADTAGDFGSNLAVGALVADVSSEFSNDFSAENAVDGDLSTQWSSKGDGDDAFITIDLGELLDVTAVGFRTRSMSDGSATTETFTVEVDGAVYGPFPAGIIPSEVSFRGRVLTYRVETSSGGNTGAVEVEAFFG